MTPKVASHSSISESIAYCRKALPLTSRTFALGIELLADPLRDEIGVAYLICRVLDTIEDTTSLPAKSRSDLLRAWPEHFMDSHNWPMLAADVEKMFAQEALTGQDHDLCRHCTQVGRRSEVGPTLRCRPVSVAGGVWAAGRSSWLDGREASPSVSLRFRETVDG